ncbi:protein IN CHLOROPLAST ATPASE BIOGENESIS, chloroplastic-like isoform X3 [Andrographis paniculata]|uniref:protein IN CHLOROPLAST ATPASE BIOGENESIS, chloroplastic-like isoform X3 n=1 Tax=Andrographis paniculata TaxID=175694 RepID=UPI0021E82A71|nr:protein IN CHLOROPLAST ATPASE BIOGENESIS, chloroplastic-like isoform X3 [Andrographis paniculata]
MRAGGGVLFGVPRAAAIPSGLVGRRRPSRCYSVSSSSDHSSFIKDVAATPPPAHLNHLLRILQLRAGEELISPGAKKGLIPLVVPLSKTSTGSITALLRWPTAPAGMEMPVVEVRKYGVWLLAKNVEQFINRILVEEDVKGFEERYDELFDTSAVARNKFYKKGDFAASHISSFEAYVLKKIGLFPDILERKVKQHFDKGDHVSALVTGEFYTKKEHFPGFGRPFVFNAEILLKVGRILEAKDAARGALKSPWWTLGCEYQEVAKIAQWEDEQIEYIKEKVTDEGKQQDLKKGKDPAQVALDEAAFLLDLASIDGTWDEHIHRIAECYREAGLHDIAAFILYSPRGYGDMLLHILVRMLGLGGLLCSASRVSSVSPRLPFVVVMLRTFCLHIICLSAATGCRRDRRISSCLFFRYVPS